MVGSAYRLAARTGDAVVLTGPVRVEASVWGRFELAGIAPNPGLGPAKISFTLAREAAVAMDVVDLQGRHVASLARGTLAAGARTIEWSDSWTSEDLVDATAAAVQRFEDQEREDR